MKIKNIAITIGLSLIATSAFAFPIVSILKKDGPCDPNEYCIYTEATSNVTGNLNITYSYSGVGYDKSGQQHTFSGTTPAFPFDASPTATNDPGEIDLSNKSDPKGYVDSMNFTVNTVNGTSVSPCPLALTYADLSKPGKAYLIIDKNSSGQYICTAKK